MATPPVPSRYLDVIRDEETGERIGFLSMSSEAVIFDDYIPRRMAGPPTHWHPAQSETFEVISGVAHVLVSGRWTQLGPGQRVTVPAGVPHTFDNSAGEDFVMRVTLTPGLDSDEMFRTLLALGMSKSPFKALLRLSRAQSELDSIFFMRGPALPQRMMYAVLSWIHRLFFPTRPRAPQLSTWSLLPPSVPKHHDDDTAQQQRALSTT